MKKAERKLFREDTALLANIVSDLAEFKPALAELKEAFEALTIGDFTNEVFKEIMKKGPAGVVDTFEKNLESQLDQMNVTIETLRVSFKTDQRCLTDRFVLAYNKIKSFKLNVRSYSSRRHYLSLQDVSFVDNVFVVSDADRENILEKYCRVYIETEAEAEMLVKMEDYLKAYGELKQAILKGNFAANFTMSELSRCFVDTETGIEINKSVFVGMLERARYSVD